MHVFVKGRELVEVAIQQSCHLSIEAFEQLVVDGRHVGFGISNVQERQIPTPVMRNRDGIVDGLGPGRWQIREKPCAVLLQ